MTSRLLGVTGVAGLVLVIATCDGPRGPTGPEGVMGTQGGTGAQGPAGSQGPAGVSGWEIVTVTDSILLNGAPITVRADCPTGKKVLGGGFSHVPTDPSGPFLVDAQNNYPSSATRWTVTLASGYVVATTLTVYAICGLAT